MTELADRRCEPCRSGVPPLTTDEISPLLAQLDDTWEVGDAHHLQREFRFKNFAGALALPAWLYRDRRALRGQP